MKGRGSDTSTYIPLEYVHGPERKAWDLQQKESLKHYDWFKAYRDLEPDARSYLAVALKFNKAVKTITITASKNRWQERLAIWMDFLSKSESKAVQKAIDEMNRETAKQARAFKSTLMLPVHAFLKKMQEGKISFEEMSTDRHFSMIVKAAANFANVADAERKAKGQPTEITQSNVDHTTGGEALKPQITIEVKGSKSMILNELFDKEYDNKSDES